MKCAIMQPTYLPWAGYFKLMNEVDLFIFLDDVSFSKGSWQQRNRIIANKAETYLTVPVNTSGKLGQLINEVETVEIQNWRKKHKIALQLAYSKHEFGSEIIELISNCLDNSTNSLVDVNVSIIKAIKEKLNIDTEIKLSSELEIFGKKSEYILNICNHIGATQYYSPEGAREYIEEEGLFAKSNVKVEYQNFIPKAYSQKNIDNFVPYMSIIDIIANIGFNETKKYITRQN